MAALPPPPLTTPLDDQSGKITQPWAKWLQLLWDAQRTLASSSGSGVTLGGNTPIVASGLGAPGTNPEGSHQDHVHPEQASTAADVVNAAAIAAEAVTRAAADSTLTSAITSEASTRASADSSEASTRASADTTLATAITSEASTRASADTTLTTAITTEASARAAADALLVVANAGITPATGTKITADAKGLVTAVANAAFTDITGEISDAQHGNRAGGALHANAGGGSAGFMTDAQSTKLGGIAAGATVGVTSIGAVGAGDANALSISGTTLTAHVATATQPGVIAAADQDLGTYVRSVGSLELQNNTPSAPSAGKVRQFAKTRGMAEAYLRYINNISAGVQPRIGHRRVIMIKPRGAGDTTIDQWGSAVTNTGAATSPALASTNINTSTPHQLYTANAGTTIATEVRENAVRHWIGNAAGLGGFYLVARFAHTVQSAANLHRWLCGLASTTGTFAAANEPSVATNFIGIGKDSADSTVQMLHNDSTGNCTKDDSFITPATTAQMYELHMYCPPNGSAVEIYFEICNGGSSDTYSASSNLPTNTTFLCFHCWAGSGTGSATAVTVEFAGLYIESDY